MHSRGAKIALNGTQPTIREASCSLAKVAYNNEMQIINLLLLVYTGRYL